MNEDSKTVGEEKKGSENRHIVKRAHAPKTERKTWKFQQQNKYSNSKRLKLKRKSPGRPRKMAGTPANTTRKLEVQKPKIHRQSYETYNKELRKFQKRTELLEVIKNGKKERDKLRKAEGRDRKSQTSKQMVGSSRNRTETCSRAHVPKNFEVGKNRGKKSGRGPKRQNKEPEAVKNE
jgi:hypothetical protein